MGMYDDAQQARKYLTALIDERINENANVKSAIKARKATVEIAASGGKVGVKLLGDSKILTLPYNTARFAETEDDLQVTTPRTVVWVWYCQSLNNGIVMQNADWTK